MVRSPKERLSLLLFFPFFFFFLFFFIVFFISPLILSPLPLPLLIFIISERRKHKRRRERKGREKIYVTILTLCFLSHFLRLKEMTLHQSKKEMSLTLAPDQIRHQNHHHRSSFFFQFIAIISQLFLLFINCNKNALFFLLFLLLLPPIQSLRSNFQLLSSCFPILFIYIFGSNLSNHSCR